MKPAKQPLPRHSGPTDRMRQHLYALLAVNFSIVGLIAAFFWYHQQEQDRILDRIVNYHTITVETVQASLTELHYVSDGLWRQAMVGEDSGALSSSGPEAAAGQKTVAEHISNLARQREIFLELQQRFGGSEYTEATDSVLRALDPVLLIGSPAGQPQGDFYAQRRLIGNLDLRLQDLLKLHLGAQEGLAESSVHRAFSDPVYLLVMAGLLIGLGIAVGTAIIRSVTAAGEAREMALDALGQNEKRLKRLTDSLESAQRIARIGNWEWDAESGAEWWSDEKYRIIGFEPGSVEPSGKAILHAIHEADREEAARTIEYAEKTATPYILDCRVVLPNGEERHIRKIGEPVFDSNGRPTGQRGTIQDITEQRMAETRMAETVRRLETAQRIAGVADWGWDPESQFLDWPAQMREVLGLPTGDEPISNDDFISMLHPEDSERLKEEMWRAIKTGRPYALEYRFLAPDGQVRNIMEYGEPFTDPDSGKTMLRGTIQDITERKAIERQLAKAVADLNRAQRLAKMGSWVWDIANDEAIWSEECYRIHGLEPGSRLPAGSTYLSYVHPDDREAVQAARDRAISEGESLSIEFRLVGADDVERVVQTLVEVSHDEQGVAIRLSGTIQDVSELRDREKELRETREKFLLAFQLSPSATAISDIESGRHVDVNDKWVEILGHSRDEAIGRTAAEMGIWANPEDRARAISLLRKDGKLREFETQYRTHDGELRDFLVSAEPFPVGNRPHMLIVGHDITERKAIEQELRETADRLEKSQRVGKIGSWVWEFAEGREWWSDEVYRIYGLEVGTHTPNSFDFLNYVHPDDRDKTLAGLERTIRDRTPFTAEYRVRRADGAERILFEQSEVEYDAEGKPVRLRGTAQDITERKKAELALLETKERLEEAQHLGQMGSWAWNPEEDLAWGSDEQYRIFGLEPGSVVLNSFGFLKYVHPDDLDRVEKIERNAAETRTPFTIEYRIVRPDGTERTVLEHGEWIEQDIAGKAQWRGVIQDITERKQIELELARLNEELERRVEERTAELRAAQDELVKRERLATLGQLTATVSHELRNPLGAIRTSIYVVEKLTPLDDRRTAEAFRRINRNITRCDNIIDELLDYTRIRDMLSQNLSIDNWLVAVLAEQKTPSGISVHTNFNIGDLRVSADPDRLRRAVINIYENACQAMAPSGTVDSAESASTHCLSITTRLNKNRAEIVLEDTGPGIEHDAHDRIFEPLFSTKNFGVGLGLPIVRQIMEQHGGGVEAANSETGGARFVLWLPLLTEMENGGSVAIETNSKVD